MTNPDFYNSLTEPEQVIFNQYKSNTNSFCFNLNDGLRRGNAEEFLNELTVLYRIISLNQNTDIITLHRATNEQNILPFIDNDTYLNPDFLSTSFDLESAQYHFTNPINPVYLTITCKIGTHMALLETNAMFSGTENEALLGRKNQMKVSSIRLTTVRNEIENIMGREFAVGVFSLRIN